MSGLGSNGALTEAPASAVGLRLELSTQPQAHLPFEFVRGHSCASLAFHAGTEFRQSDLANNFTRGVRVAPDGLCMLSNSDDHVLRLFEIQDDSMDAHSVLQCKEGGTVYDFAWYPFMNSQDPTSCIFVSTSKDHPVHMWDAYTGQLRATYRAFDHLDEITAGLSVAFNATGDKIFVGFDRTIRYFDITQPSRDFVTRALCKTRKSRQGQRGIISSIHFNPDFSRIYAAGSYHGSTVIYAEDSGEELLQFRDHDGRGITQVQFSPDGRYLLTAARKDSRIQCWDIRQTNDIVHTLHRVANTNQRVEFDIHGGSRYVVSGSQDGKVLLYDLLTGALVDDTVQLPDAANGVSFFPDLDRARVAVCSGQRHYELSSDMEEPEEQIENTMAPKRDERNVVRVYEYKQKQPLNHSNIGE